MFKIFGATISVALLLGTGASAATFAGNTEGTFRDDYVGSATNSCLFDAYGNGENSGVAWGDPDDCPDTNGIYQDDSQLWFVDTPFSADIDGSGKIKIGEIHWFNDANTAAHDFAAIGDWTLTITDPVGAVYTEALAFNIRNTLNPESDRILALIFEDFGLDLPIFLGDLEITDFSFELLTDNGADETLYVLEKHNGDLKLKWINPEKKTSSIGLFAHVSHVPAIPLPAAGWLLIGSIGGLAAMSRRKRRPHQ